jgi:hypothetical protein
MKRIGELLFRIDARVGARMRQPVGTLLAIIAFAALTAFFHNNWYLEGRMTEYPAQIHAWSQTDRYAIALGFVEHGFNIFTPHTYVLNPEFPPDRPLPSPEGITQVDFPVHEWLIAWIMHLSNNTNPEIFRFYMLVLSTIGLWFLLMAARLLSGSLTVGLLAVVLAQTIPVWSYYAIGFIPSISALSTAFVGLWFLARYCRRAERGHEFLWAVVFFTLSALVRFPFVILLLALVPFLIWESVRLRKFIVEWKWWAVGLMAVAGYFIYNSWLASYYGSVFLREPVPMPDTDTLRAILAEAWQRWGDDWITDHHFWFGVFLLPVVLLLLLFRGPQKFSPFLLFGITALGGGLAYALLMLPKFDHHDYYFLDSLYLPIIALMVSALAYLARMWPPVWILLLPIGFYVIKETNVSVKKSLHLRYAPQFWNDMPDCHAHFAMSVNWLNGLIKPVEKPIVWSACAPNVPFVHLRRKGYQYMQMNKTAVQHGIESEHFVVCQNQRFGADVYPLLLEGTGQVELQATNNKIGLYRVFAGNNQASALSDLLGFKPQYALFDPEVHDLFMTDTTQFAELFRTELQEGISDGFQVCLELETDTFPEGVLFCQMKCGEDLTYYRGRPLSSRYHSFSIPESQAGCELNIYIMKTVSVSYEAKIRDFRIFKVPVAHGKQQHLR